MPTKADFHATMEQVELILDAHGLADLLNMITQICDAKAEHVASSWQDDATAKTWAKAGEAVERALDGVIKSGV